MRSTCDAHALPIHPTLSLQGSPIILANVSGSLPFPWQWINVALYDNDLTITTTRKIFWTGEEGGGGRTRGNSSREDEGEQANEGGQAQVGEQADGRGEQAVAR